MKLEKLIQISVFNSQLVTSLQKLEMCDKSKI